MARGLLILFKPFINELVEIHTQDVKRLLFDNKDMIEEKRAFFEKYKLMSDLISTIQSDVIEDGGKNIDDEEDSNDQETESTSNAEIVDFNKWART